MSAEQPQSQSSDYTKFAEYSESIINALDKMNVDVVLANDKAEHITKDKAIRTELVRHIGNVDSCRKGILTTFQNAMTLALKAFTSIDTSINGINDNMQQMKDDFEDMKTQFQQQMSENTSNISSLNEQLKESIEQTLSNKLNESNTNVQSLTSQLLEQTKALNAHLIDTQTKMKDETMMNSDFIGDSIDELGNQITSLNAQILSLSEQIKPPNITSSHKAAAQYLIDHVQNDKGKSIKGSNITVQNVAAILEAYDRLKQTKKSKA